MNYVMLGAMSRILMGIIRKTQNEKLKIDVTKETTFQYR